MTTRIQSDQVRLYNGFLNLAREFTVARSGVYKEPEPDITFFLFARRATKKDPAEEKMRNQQRRQARNIQARIVAVRFLLGTMVKPDSLGLDTAEAQELQRILDASSRMLQPYVKWDEKSQNEWGVVLETMEDSIRKANVILNGAFLNESKRVTQDSLVILLAFSEAINVSELSRVDTKFLDKISKDTEERWQKPRTPAFIPGLDSMKGALDVLQGLEREFDAWKKEKGKKVAFLRQPVIDAVANSAASVLHFLDYYATALPGVEAVLEKLGEFKSDLESKTSSVPDGVQLDFLRLARLANHVLTHTHFLNQVRNYANTTPLFMFDHSRLFKYIEAAKKRLSDVPSLFDEKNAAFFCQYDFVLTMEALIKEVSMKLFEIPVRQRSAAVYDFVGVWSDEMERLARLAARGKFNGSENVMTLVMRQELFLSGKHDHPVELVFAMFEMESILVQLSEIPDVRDLAPKIGTIEGQDFGTSDLTEEQAQLLLARALKDQANVVALAHIDAMFPALPFDSRTITFFDEFMKENNDLLARMRDADAQVYELNSRSEMEYLLQYDFSMRSPHLSTYIDRVQVDREVRDRDYRRHVFETRIIPCGRAQLKAAFESARAEHRGWFEGDSEVSEQIKDRTDVVLDELLVLIDRLEADKTFNKRHRFSVLPVDEALANKTVTPEEVFAAPETARIGVVSRLGLERWRKYPNMGFQEVMFQTPAATLPSVSNRDFKEVLERAVYTVDVRSRYGLCTQNSSFYSVWVLLDSLGSQYKARFAGLDKGITKEAAWLVMALMVHRRCPWMLGESSAKEAALERFKEFAAKDADFGAFLFYSSVAAILGHARWLFRLPQEGPPRVDDLGFRVFERFVLVEMQFFLDEISHLSLDQVMGSAVYIDRNRSAFRVTNRWILSFLQDESRHARLFGSVSLPFHRVALFPRRPELPMQVVSRVLGSSEKGLSGKSKYSDEEKRVAAHPRAHVDKLFPLLDKMIRLGEIELTERVYPPPERAHPLRGSGAHTPTKFAARRMVFV